MLPAAAVLLAVASLTQGVLVETPLGTVSGFHDDYGSDTSKLWYGEGDVFLGIPFAQPPIGDLRFKLPQPLQAYPNGAVSELDFKPACIQPSSSSCGVQSEDCLYLNVFTPNATSEQKYPVMVWIHGGSLTGGCAMTTGPRGVIRNLVSRGVVVVTIQYRLNVLGFFTTNTDDFPANRGMLDQVMAIRWVRDNIAYFGGNPFAITLFGQSAGGISVSAHTYSPLSQGLFQQAIQESGSLFVSLEGELGTLDLSKHRAIQLCNITAAEWDSKDFARLKLCMAELQPSSWADLDAGTLFGWRMVLDDYFLPDSPEKLNEKRPLIPVMAGTMRDEFASTWYYQMSAQHVPFELMSKEFVRFAFEYWGSFYGARENDVWNVVTSSYVPRGTADTDAAVWWLQSCQFFTAAGFTQWTIKDLQLYQQRGNPNLYVYEQTYGTRLSNYAASDNVTQRLGGYRPVPHAQELPFIFMYYEQWEEAIAQSRVMPFDLELADWYGQAWTNFAKFGRPTLDNSWRPLDKSGLRHFVIGQPEAGGLRMATGYRDLDKTIFQDVVTALATPGLPATTALGWPQICEQFSNK